VLLIEAIGVRPIDHVHDGRDVVGGLRSKIHLVRVLIHVEDKDGLAASERGRMIRGPAVSENHLFLGLALRVTSRVSRGL
jgi:hypothetical protein